jgi:mono/diheme cytochrome c family protein
MSRALPLAAAVLGLSVAVAAGYTAGAADAPASGAALMQSLCVGCHTLETVTAKGRTPDEWSEEVESMLDRGLIATPEQIAQIKAYLAKTYPPAH